MAVTGNQGGAETAAAGGSGRVGGGGSSKEAGAGSNPPVAAALERRKGASRCDNAASSAMCSRRKVSMLAATSSLGIPSSSSVAEASCRLGFQGSCNRSYCFGLMSEWALQHIGPGPWPYQFGALRL